MDARELRIGNFVKWAEDDSESPLVLTITGSLNGGDMWAEWVCDDGKKDDADCAIEELAPIPLTEEWLTRFGFEYIETGEEVYEQKWVKNAHEIVWGPDSENKFYHNFLTGGCVEHVHTLQNLYFALTGAELELKDAENND